MKYALEPDRMIDISRPLSNDTPVWPGDTPVSISRRTESGFRTSKMTISSHSGTHMDAPAHMTDFQTTIDQLSPSNLILPAIVLDCSSRGVADAESINGEKLSGSALLLNTGSGYMTADAAERAIDGGVKLVGIDGLSIDGPGRIDVHRILLGASVPIVENLMLESVRPGKYLLVCLPLKILTGDGSPVRALLQPMSSAAENC
jgi:arylformamidase